MINVCILGSSGSIGKQTLSVIRRYSDLFRVVALVCGSDADILISQAEEFKPEFVGIADESKANKLKLSYPCQVYAGKDAQKIAASLPSVDVVVAAVVGLAGLEGVVSAIKAGKKVALANKETLVSCGEYITNLAKEKNVDILPVDSEHCAVFQCLKSGEKRDVSRIILTASGGPFYGVLGREELASITPEQAVKHPNWSMGKKISVDSATMMNKGLEIIEARWLFDCKNIDYVIQPDSIIHSMVEYKDGAIIAQIARPTMEMPIQYALTYPRHLDMEEAKFDFSKDIRFLKKKEDLFPMPKFCKEALKIGGTAPCLVNAANEAAVALFLKRKISFTDITDIVEHTLNTGRFSDYTSYEEIIAMHDETVAKINQKFDC